MAERRQHPNGGIYERNRPGEPWRLVGTAQPNSIQTKPADPTIPFKTREAQNSADASQYAAPKAAADATIAQANAANAPETARANAIAAQAAAQLKQLEIDAKRLEIAEKQKGDKNAQEINAKRELLEATTQKLVGLYGNYVNNYKGGTILDSVAESLPDRWSSANSGFNADAAGLSSLVKPYTRVEGEGPQSDVDFLQFLAANQPEAQAKDTANEARFNTMTTRINALRKSYGMPEVDFDAAVVKPEEASAELPADKTALAKGNTKSEVDPFLKGVAGRVGKMLSDGVDGGKISDFMRKNGIDPKNTSLREALQHRQTKDFKMWKRQNPGEPYPIGPNFYTKDVELSPAASLHNSAAQSAPGAFAISAGNAVLGNQFGNIADMAGNGEQVRTGLRAVRDNAPTASFLGDVAGQVGFEAIAGRIPGIRGLQGRRFGQLGMDAGYGALVGSGSEEGAVMGALANAGGGAIGRTAHRVGTTAARGVQDANLGYLHRQGVEISPGRIANAAGGPVGRFLGRAEETMAGNPLTEGFVNTARRRGDESFNAAAFRQMPGHSGAVGSHGVAEGQGIVDQAYSFLDNTNLPLDAPYAGTQAGIRASLPNLPRFGQEIDASLNAIDGSAVNGTMPGRAWQDGIRATRADRSSIASEPFSRPAMDAMGDVEQNLMGLAQRQGPAGTVDRLNEANAIYPLHRTLTDAVRASPAQRNNEMFSAVGLDTSSMRGAANHGGVANAVSGNRPFYDLTTAGKAVMPNLTPDSGTAGRALFNTAITGAAVGGAGGLGAAAASDDINAAEGGIGGGAGMAALASLPLMALYSRPGGRAVQNAMLGDRPNVQAMEAFLQANPRLRSVLSRRVAGMFGGGAARDLMLYPEE